MNILHSLQAVYDLNFGLQNVYHFFGDRYQVLTQWQISLKKRKRFFYLKCQLAVMKKISSSGGIVCIEILQLTGTTSSLKKSKVWGESLLRFMWFDGVW